METNKNIHERVDHTLHSLEQLQPVNVSPFFKDKTMQRLFAEKEVVESKSLFSWFTPQLQLAMLVCVLAINVYAIAQIKNSSYNASISSFASEYGLTTETNSSILNL
ncbi:hypothetical protein [Olleya aquimaris]|uniref:Uncharacterized protein n=1 Tax=Olleya aquimaris TaxID=639310 RepID=A0A327RL26_9FLAO|nr:hypothetical protein [Olleya aquimaris]RAJ16878.1 hypothetical protein LY08_00654 [Olleya aquimaris]